MAGCRSIFRWKEVIEDNAETVVVMKTVVERLPELKRELEAHHPYEVPELLALPVRDGLSEYLAWVTAETADGEAVSQ